MTDYIIPLTTHGLVAVMFYVLGKIVTIRSARTWPERPHLEDVMHGEHGGHHPHGPDRPGETHAEGSNRRKLVENGRLTIILLAASLFVIVLGVQAYVEQRDQAADDRREDRQVACFEAWGKGMVETVTTRTDSTIKLEDAAKKLTAAEARRDSAIDEILLTVIAFRKIPPEADDADFTRALAEYQAALRARDKVRGNLDAVENEIDTVREQNPYPELHC